MIHIHCHSSWVHGARAIHTPGIWAYMNICICAYMNMYTYVCILYVHHVLCVHCRCPQVHNAKAIHTQVFCAYVYVCIYECLHTRLRTVSTPYDIHTLFKPPPARLTSNTHASNMCMYAYLNTCIINMYTYIHPFDTRWYTNTVIALKCSTQ